MKNLKITFTGIIVKIDHFIKNIVNFNTENGLFLTGFKYKDGESKMCLFISGIENLPPRPCLKTFLN